MEKKNYIAPAIRCKNVQPQSIIAASPVGLLSTPANPSDGQLSKLGDDFFFEFLGTEGEENQDE